MDRIFFNGYIRTLDNERKIAEAIGVKDGKIAFIGSNEEAKAMLCEERIDLNGRLMLPGFVDSHLHMLHYAFVEKSVKLFDCKSVDEILTLVKERIAKRSEKPLTWLFCRGWNEEK